MKNRINVKKTVITVIIINIMQLFIIGGLIIYDKMNFKNGHYNDITTGSIIVFILIFFVSMNSFIVIKYIIFKSLSGSDSEHLKEVIEQMEKLNTVLRAQRHDFMNHLQVVYSLIEMKEFNEANTYIETVYKDIQKVNRSLKTANPAVNALIQAKTIYCEEKKIDVDINISTQLNHIRIPSWELCRVIGNILDNAAQALEGKENDKRVAVKIYEDIKNYEIVIGNNGSKIPEEYIKKIFEVGFTTKKEKGDGMGLAISKEIINKYEGNISVISEDNWTEFTIVIPICSETLDGKHDIMKQ